MNFTELENETKRMLHIIRSAYAINYPDSQTADLDLDFEEFEIQEDKIHFYSASYNISCSCHPEDERDCITIPLDIANTLDREKITECIRQQKAEYDERMKREREERDIEKKERVEASERVELERLQKKFNSI